MSTTIAASTFLADGFLGELWDWFTDPAHWSGEAGIPNRVWYHLVLSSATLITATLIALPLGFAIGRSRMKGTIPVNTANLGRAIPSFAILVLGVVIFGLGTGAAYVALALLAIPPIFTLAFTGVRSVDPAVLDAARGMGMGEGRLLTSVQIPLATPVVADGMRLAGSAVLATATLAALIGGGGLGRYIIDGFAVRDFVRVTAGVVLVAVLVIANELVWSTVARHSGARRDRRARAG